MVRKIIVGAIAVIILVGGFTLSRKLSESKKPQPRKVEQQVTTVFTTKVKNADVPLHMNVTGPLRAKNRIELYSEVQGVMLSDEGRFKPGTQFSAGQTLVEVRSDDFRAGLMAQKSTLQNLVTALLADIRMDFPESLDRWNAFLRQMDVNAPLPELPLPASDKERLFVSGRNIHSTYYNIKNAELVLGKYRIAAPFSGVLTMALVNSGTVIRPGQKLGEFIDPSIFELEASVNASMVSHIKVGQTVSVRTTENDGRKWQGRVSRINRLIDGSTQTISVFIDVSGDGLEEGMFLTADIAAGRVANAFEIPRSVLFDTDQVFVVKDTVLLQVAVKPVHFKERSVIVSGLPDGAEVLTRMAPGAYPGMRVSIYQQ
jgi:membrane fusion protein, multidrug efflux system